MRNTLSIAVAIGLLIAAVCGPEVAAGAVKPPKNPARIDLEVSPASVPAGGKADVTLTIAPIDGVKIARYPQIRLQVPESLGLVGAAEVRIGSRTPPPPDRLNDNYWKQVDPVTLTLAVDASATSGAHEIEAKLTYYFCVSGNYCAPARVPLTIPLAVD